MDLSMELIIHASAFSVYKGKCNSQNLGRMKLPMLKLVIMVKLTMKYRKLIKRFKFWWKIFLERKCIFIHIPKCRHVSDIVLRLNLQNREASMQHR